jgi:hypothetical protein
MVQDTVIGTLAALNLLVSPLSPNTLASQSYRYELESTPEVLLIQQSCRDQSRLKRGHVEARFELLTDSYFTLNLETHLCGDRSASAKIAMNLPTEILDESFWQKLKPGQSYIVPGIPTAGHPDTKSNIKISRLIDHGALQGLQVESLPNIGSEPARRLASSRPAAVPPLAIWMDRDRNAFAEVPGFRKGTLRWKQLALHYHPTELMRDIALLGELKRIEDTPSVKK